MITALLCRQMGWTWQEYQEQPADFIDTVTEMFKAETEAQNKK